MNGNDYTEEIQINFMIVRKPLSRWDSSQWIEIRVLYRVRLHLHPAVFLTERSTPSIRFLVDPAIEKLIHPEKEARRGREKKR